MTQPKAEHHRLVSDVPMDIQFQGTDETQLEEPKLKKRKKLYSQTFRLNGEVDEVRNCVKGIEGLILGPKTRYITIVLKGNKLFSVSTLPPTPANKVITDQILPTLNFK